MNSILLTILLKELQVLKTSNVKVVIFNYVRIAACILVKAYIYINQKICILLHTPGYFWSFITCNLSLFNSSF